MIISGEKCETNLLKYRGDLIVNNIENGISSQGSVCIHFILIPLEKAFLHLFFL